MWNMTIKTMRVCVWWVCVVAFELLLLDPVQSQWFHDVQCDHLIDCVHRCQLFEARWTVAGAGSSSYVDAERLSAACFEACNEASVLTHPGSSRHWKDCHCRAPGISLRQAEPEIASRPKYHQASGDDLWTIKQVSRCHCRSVISASYGLYFACSAPLCHVMHLLILPA